MRLLLAQHQRPRRLDGVENLLIKLERELRSQRRGRSPADDLRNLRGVVRSRRKALAGCLNLAEAGDQLLAQHLAKHSGLDIALEVLVVDVHCLYDTVTVAPAVDTCGSMFRPRRKARYASRNDAAFAALSHRVSARTLPSR